MKGMKEILVSFTVAFATLGTLTYVRNSVINKDLRQLDTQATEISGRPDDPALDLNWGLQAIDADEAWQKQSGDRNVVVAIIDTGCDVHHPSLKENIWRNPGESGLDEFGESRATNGVDDDDNGFVDDVHGWNFAGQDANVMDEHGHGTHIAGIIGARKPNGTGLNGVAPDVSLMILKYYDTESSGIQNLDNTIKAIRYAVRMGADIINYSGGGLMKSPEEEEMLRWAGQQGVLVVAAAGNEGMNSDFFPFYPADYDLPNILSVGAMDRSGSLMELSNHGIHTVDIAAPGKNIYSTLPNGQFGYMSGTSQATAFATGVAVLLKAHDSRMNDPEAVIHHMAASGRPQSHLKTKTSSGMVLNAAVAIENLDLNLALTPNARNPAENRGP